MKRNALVKEYRKPGAVLKELDIPRLKSKEILVRTMASAICGTDIHIYNWDNWADARVKPPIIFGHEFSGEVVKVGSHVTTVQPGDLVAGETHIPCGECLQCRTGIQHICKDMNILGVHTDGAFSDYVIIPEICAWKLPPGTNPEIGALYEPFGVAAHGVFIHNLIGSSVIVFGCGPIGLFAVSIAKLAGASHIYAVDLIDFRLGMAKDMGATVTINPKEQDVVAVVEDFTHGIGIDCVIELSGNPVAIKQGFAVLRNGGAVSLLGLPSKEVVLDLTKDIIYKEAKVFGSTGRHMFDTWYKVSALLQNQKIDISRVITHRFKLSEYEEAFRTLIDGSGEIGKVLLIP